MIDPISLHMNSCHLVLWVMVRIAAVAAGDAGPGAMPTWVYTAKAIRMITVTLRIATSDLPTGRISGVTLIRRELPQLKPK